MSSHPRRVRYARSPPHLLARLTPRAPAAHYKDVLAAFYDYLALLRDSPLAPHHFAELMQMSAINFRFQEKVQPHTYVGWLARELARPYPPAEVLSASDLFLEWDERAVRELLETYILPEKGRVTLQAREHPEVPSDAWKTERWYGAEYCVRRLDEELLKKASGNALACKHLLTGVTLQTRRPGDNKGLYLPGPNEFIPSDLSVETQVDPTVCRRHEVALSATSHLTTTFQPALQPACILRSPLSTLWFKKDDQFGVPRASARIDIRRCVFSFDISFSAVSPRAAN